MKMNPNCMKDMLLELESRLTAEHHWTVDPIPIYDLAVMDGLEGYDFDEVTYHAFLLENMKLIQLQQKDVHDYSVVLITYKGHRILAELSQGRPWEEVVPKYMGY